jgi:cytosine/adenosine deaminase-related metal-dependent hydrolase
VRAALWAQHLRRNHPSIGFPETARTLLLNNALAAQRHWEMPIGELKEGALADIIGIPYQPRTPIHEDNVYAPLLFGLSQEAVDTTIVGGWVLMHNRKLTIDVDEAEAAARCRELAARLYQRMGV